MLQISEELLTAILDFMATRHTWAEVNPLMKRVQEEVKRVPPPKKDE